MKRKSLTVKNKVHKKILSYLKDKEFKKIYKNFEEFLKYRKISSFVVALSGGSDSLALAYFSKCFQILNNKILHFFLMNRVLIERLMPYYQNLLKQKSNISLTDKVQFFF